MYLHVLDFRMCPYGMVFIPQGSFNMGPSDQDVPTQTQNQGKVDSTKAKYFLNNIMF